MNHSNDLASEAAELRRRNRELAVLNAIAQALSASVALDDVLRVTLAQVADFFGLRTGWVWLLHPATGAPYLAAAQHLPPGLARNPARMEGWCYCLETYADGDLDGAANVNIITCSRLKPLLGEAGGLRYHASIPLYAEGAKKIGMLNVASPDWRELSPGDLRLLHTIGGLLSIAVERARLFAASNQMGALAERNRLAREIHDTLAQGLAALTLHLESADAQLEAGAAADQVRATVQRALALARANLEEARRSVVDLRGAALDGRTLAQALRALVQEYATEDGPRLRCTVVGATIPLPPRVEAGVLRIAQEALANALHHAQARQITLRLVVTPGLVRLSVRDDGMGFEPAALPGGHFGLVGVRERAKLLGGNAQISSQPGHGTHILVTIPMQEAAR
jgi:two-component system NarL family sensor kinase